MFCPCGHLPEAVVSGLPFPGPSFIAANATPDTDMLSAIMSAAINNVMRFLICSHPLSLIVLNTIGPKRDAWRVEAHAKAPPLLLCRGWGSLFRTLSVVTPPPFGSPATSLEERGPWALRPRLAAGLPLSRRRSARAHVNHRTNLEEGDIYAEWPFIWSQAGQLYARWLFLAHELQGTQEGRTS